MLHACFWVQEERVLLFRNYASGKSTHFSYPVKSRRLMADQWQYHTLEVQLPVSLAWRATYQHPPMAESLKACAVLFRERREKSAVGAIHSDGKGQLV